MPVPVALVVEALTTVEAREWLHVHVLRHCVEQEAFVAPEALVALIARTSV